MKNPVFYLLFSFVMLSLNGCSSDDEVTQKGRVPSSSNLLPIEQLEKASILPSNPNDEITMSVLFDVADVLWYNTKTGEIKFNRDYSMDELYQKGYISKIGDNDFKYKTFVFTNAAYSQIVNCPVLYQNNLADNKYYLVRGYPFWNELSKEQQAERNEKLDELLPSWFEFLNKLKEERKLK